MRVPFTVEAAHKKGAGSTKNGRDSVSKRRGIKVYGGQPVRAGGIIFRQVGSTWYPGQNVGIGKDYTVFSLIDGVVLFDKKREGHSKIHVFPADHAKSVAQVAKTHTVAPKEGTMSRSQKKRATHDEKYGPNKGASTLSVATVSAPITP